MERFTRMVGSRMRSWRREIGTAVSGYVAIALLLMSAALLPATGRAAVSISGTPPASIVAQAGVYDFVPTVSDSSNATLQFSISGKPYWATFVTTTGELYGGTYPDNIGTYTNIVISVTDGTSSASLGPFSISVLAPGTAGTASLQLSAASYTVAQTAGNLTVQVNRTVDFSQAVSVTYSTADGSAVAGQDYTAVSGTVNWAVGDTAAKSFVVPVSNATPFTGTRSFTIALSSPSSGAQVGTPGTASAAITGSAVSSGGGTGTSSAVTNLLLVQQGGTNNATAPVTNSQALSWSAATAGANPISFYKIYRNGVAYATTTGLTYTDTAATASNDPTYATVATVYSYNVSAVDTAGNEGPLAANVGVYAYRNGQSNWSNNDLSYGTLVENYSSTDGNPQNGTYDISVDFISGGFQPAVAPAQAPMWDLEIGAFNYAVIDVNPGPTVNGTQIIFGTVSRLPPGDVYGWHPGLNVYDYGPAPVANTWATYKIPLAALGMGTCELTGSISGNTLTVTAVVSGPSLVDAGGFITGPGIPAGTYITAYGQNAAIGTFTVAGPGISDSTNVASTTLQFQRTSLYKFGMQPDIQGMTLYFNNMGFTVN